MGLLMANLRIQFKRSEVKVQAVMLRSRMWVTRDHCFLKAVVFAEGMNHSKCRRRGLFVLYLSGEIEY